METGKRTEEQWERKLKIKTGGGKNHEADGENFPYEPTPYAVLCRLAESGLLSKDNILVDYGCGKGRASLFLSFMTGCRVVGIDYKEELILTAKENLEASALKHVSFLQGKAEAYRITDEDCFFLFNPFSEVILQKVIGQILLSWYEKPRKMRLFYYYPADEAVALLMTTDELVFMDEIDCSDLFTKTDRRERILIFETP